MAEKFDLSRAMNQLLMEYGDQIRDAISDVLPKVAKEAVDQLREKSPKRTGKYAKSWNLQSWQDSEYYVGVTVYNRDHYQLTHLLEYGHDVTRGQVKIGEAQPHQHIYPVEQWANKELIDEVKRKVESIK